jgi:hypothetical protein
MFRATSVRRAFDVSAAATFRALSDAPRFGAGSSSSPRLQRQGCQICLGTAFQNGKKYTKWQQNIPNGHKNIPPDNAIFTKKIPNEYKIYRMTTQCLPKNTKWPQNILNGHKIYQHLPLQDSPKFTQIGIFGL